MPVLIQVIEGRTSDRDGLERQFHRWADDLRPGAIGFLGSTVGVADDGEVVAFARFSSESAAAENGARPDQGAWWNETAKFFDAAPSFHDCTDVEVLLAGGSDASTFVQLMRGRCADRARLRDFEERTIDELQRIRPDLIGSLRVWKGERFWELAYFTSEDEARAGEARMNDAALAPEWASLTTEMTFVDLRRPLIV